MRFSSIIANVCVWKIARKPTWKIEVQYFLVAKRLKITWSVCVWRIRSRQSFYGTTLIVSTGCNLIFIYFFSEKSLKISSFFISFHFIFFRQYTFSVDFIYFSLDTAWLDCWNTGWIVIFFIINCRCEWRTCLFDKSAKWEMIHPNTRYNLKPKWTPDQSLFNAGYYLIIICMWAPLTSEALK